MAEIIYTPMELIPPLEKVLPRAGFFRSLFADSDSFHHGSEEFFLDKVDGVRGIATYVNRDGEYVKVPSQGYQSNKFKPGYVMEKMIITPKDLRNRDAGVANVYGQQRPGNKLETKVGEQFAKLEERMVRLEEKQCSEALSTGKVIVKGEGVDYEVDFGLKASHKVVASPYWTDTTNAKAVTDLRNNRALIIRDSGSVSGVVRHIMDETSWALFEQNAEFQLWSTKTGFDNVNYKPSMENNIGATYIGFIPTVGEIWTYFNEYNDTDGTTKNFMPEKRVISVAADARLEAHYGVLENLNASTNGMRGKRLPQTIKDDYGKGYENTLESSPLMSLINEDSIAVLTTQA